MLLLSLLLLLFWCARGAEPHLEFASEPDADAPLLHLRADAELDEALRDLSLALVACDQRLHDAHARLADLAARDAVGARRRDVREEVADVRRRRRRRRGRQTDADEDVADQREAVQRDEQVREEDEGDQRQRPLDVGHDGGTARRWCRRSPRSPRSRAAFVGDCAERRAGTTLVSLVRRRWNVLVSIQLPDLQECSLSCVMEFDLTQVSTHSIERIVNFVFPLKTSVEPIHRFD